MKPIIIVPAFNEEANIEKVIDMISVLNIDYIVINDGSVDDTEMVLRRKNIEHLSLSVNVGIAAVTQMGFRYAIDNGYDAAIVVDGDGQHPAQFVLRLLKELDNGYDYVIGSRFIGRKKPWNMRMLGSRIITACIYLVCGKMIYDPTSGMRALKKGVLLEFARDMNYIAEPDALAYLLRKGYKVKEVLINIEERKGGVSYFIDPIRSIKFMISVIVSVLLIQLLRGRNEH